MPLYKSGIDMFKKWKSKYNPTVVGTRFTDVSAVAEERAQGGLNYVHTVRELVRPILDQYGVTGGMRANYLAFALALWRHISRQKSEGAKKIANGLKSYFVTAYDLDPAICDEIIQVVSGWVMPY
mgnify:CR=1 FL=1